MKKIIIFFVVSFILISCGQSATTSADKEIVPGRQPNPEHLSKLLEGADAWNQWRKDNPAIVPDLGSVDLSPVNLEGYDLKRAILSNSNLVTTNFSGADLSKANLRGADLSMANLSNAILSGTRYDSRTKWPVGFDPATMGAVLVGQ